MFNIILEKLGFITAGLVTAYGGLTVQFNTYPQYVEQYQTAKLFNKQAFATVEILGLRTPPTKRMPKPTPSRISAPYTSVPWNPPSALPIDASDIEVKQHQAMTATYLQHIEGKFLNREVSVNDCGYAVITETSVKYKHPDITSVNGAKFDVKAVGVTLPKDIRPTCRNGSYGELQLQHFTNKGRIFAYVGTVQSDGKVIVKYRDDD